MPAQGLSRHIYQGREEHIRNAFNGALSYIYIFGFHGNGTVLAVNKI